MWAGFPGSPDYDDTISWGDIYEMTQTFVQHRVSEAYVIITKAHVARPDFREGFDLAKFGDAFTQMTGRPFPVVVPPDPGPTPPQPPAPGVDLAAAVAQWWTLVEHWAVDERHVTDNKHAAIAAQTLARAAGLMT